MGSIFDSIVTAVMEPAAAVAAEQPARATAAPAPSAPPAAAARSGGPARPAGAAAVGAAVSAAVAQAGAAAPPAAGPTPAPSRPAGPVPAAPARKTPAEVEAAIAAIAATRKETFNWKQSIVDLMKLLQLDSSLGARKQLAQELGYDGKLDGSAEMNLWLHKQVMQKLASGDYGTAPAR